MYRKITAALRNYFGFSRSEANGFILLSFLMILFLVAPIAVNHYLLSKQMFVYNETNQHFLDSLLATIEVSEEIDHQHKKINKSGNSATLEVDINKASVKQLVKLGFKPYIAKRIIKYRKKVKPFESVADLYSIYNIDSVLVSSLKNQLIVGKPSVKPLVRSQEDTAVISSTEKQKSTTDNYPKAKKHSIKISSIDLNSTSKEKLDEIYGIGEVLAERIIKYRDLLGGFYTTEQLVEVYGLKPEVVDTIQKYVYVEEKSISKILINIDSVKQIAQHPYINYKQARVLVNYRTQHGAFLTQDDLKNTMVLDEKEIQKLIPYISFVKN